MLDQFYVQRADQNKMKINTTMFLRSFRRTNGLSSFFYSIGVWKYLCIVDNGNHVDATNGIAISVGTKNSPMATSGEVAPVNLELAPRQVLP